jgi:hypothetical protein
MLLCGQSNRMWHYWAGRKPGSVGVLISPSYATKVPLDPWMPVVIDNGAFIAHTAKTQWNSQEWLDLLANIQARRIRPRWVAVPDVVGDKAGTIAGWHQWESKIPQEFTRAFCVQDGMTPDDVPNGADVIFVGGSDAFKFPTLPMWCGSFPRVHCARVNNPEMIERCEDLGCESVDGTGWFRDPSRPDKAQAINRFLEGKRISANQPQLAL